MSQYKPYPAYKDSGVEWLGRVPEHWVTKPLKLLVKDGSTVSYGIVQPGEALDEGVPFIQTTNMSSGDFDLASLQKTTAEIAAAFPRSRLTGGEVILGIRASIGAAFVVPVELKGVNLSRGVARIDCSSQVLSKFLVCYLGSNSVDSYWQLAKQGSTFSEVSIATVKELSVPVPSLSEQAVISSHLDRETARIDALVAKKTRFIELLREKRQALITHAVTKGLDPNVKMKDSGVEWLGAVPEHWEVRSVSSVSTKITNGYVGPTRDILVEEGVRYLQSLHIKGNQIKFDVPYFVTEEWSNQHRKSILETGDVLIVQTGDIGQVTVVTDEFAECNCHALIIVAPERSIIAGEWMSWVFNSSYGYHTLLSIQTGAMHPHLNCGNVKDVLLPVPPLTEQREIMKHIEHEERRVAALSGKTERSIELLKERRSALITAAVTGQIDLREAV